MTQCIFIVDMATIRKEQYVSTKKVVKRKRDCRKENTKRDVQRAVDHVSIQLLHEVVQVS